MTTDTRPLTTLESSVTVRRPAAVVAAFALDWGNDHLWRSRGRSLSCTPPGRATVDQGLVEEMRTTTRLRVEAQLRATSGVEG